MHAHKTPVARDSASFRLARTLKKVVSRSFRGFTLVELIVVITILAILATVGFLALSGYTSDAKDSALKANVRSVVTAISSESAITGNSPRYYVVHDAAAALTGAFAFVDGIQTFLTGGSWDAAGTNYSAGNPDYPKLKLNAEKFKVASSGIPGTTPHFLREASAAYDPIGKLSVGALDYASSATGRKRSSSFFQVAATNSATKISTVMGDFPVPSAAEVSSWASAGLVKDPSSPSSTGALVDAGISNVSSSSSSSSSGGGPLQYPACDTPDITLANGQVWAACNVGASNAWTGGLTITTCSGSATDCDLAIRNTLGSYFQWGRNDDVTASGATTTTRALAWATASTVGHSSFIKSGGDWKDSPENGNLWGGGSTTATVGTYTGQTVGDQAFMKGPCPTGYHVPTQKEWCSAIASITGQAWCDAAWHGNVSFASTLRLPTAGYRDYSSAGYSFQGTYGYYWASSPNGSNGGTVYVSTTQVYPKSGDLRGYGLSVRCLKN